MFDINKFVVLKDCMYYEGMHKYYMIHLSTLGTISFQT